MVSEEREEELREAEPVPLARVELVRVLWLPDRRVEFVRLPWVPAARVEVVWLLWLRVLWLRVLWEPVRRVEARPSDDVRPPLVRRAGGQGCSCRRDGHTYWTLRVVMSSSTLEPCSPMSEKSWALRWSVCWTAVRWTFILSLSE